MFTTKHKIKSYIKAQNLYDVDSCQKKTISFLCNHYNCSVELLTLVQNSVYNPIQVIVHNSKEKDLIFLACKNHTAPYFICSAKDSLPTRTIVELTKQYVELLKIDDTINNSYCK